MPSPEANESSPALLRFATAELLDEWLSAAGAQDPHLRLRAWRVAVRPGIFQRLLRYYERLPALRELYLSVRPESMPPVQASETSASHVAQRQAVAPTRSNTAPAAFPSGDDLASVAEGGVQVGARCRSTSQSAPGASAVSVPMDVPPLLVLALVDVVAVVDCNPPPTQEDNGEHGALLSQTQDSLDGVVGNVWPSLIVVHGEMSDVICAST